MDEAHEHFVKGVWTWRSDEPFVVLLGAAEGREVKAHIERRNARTSTKGHSAKRDISRVLEFKFWIPKRAVAWDEIKVPRCNEKKDPNCAVFPGEVARGDDGAWALRFQSMEADCERLRAFLTKNEIDPEHGIAFRIFVAVGQLLMVVRPSPQEGAAPATPPGREAAEELDVQGRVEEAEDEYAGLEWGSEAGGVGQEVDVETILWSLSSHVEVDRAHWETSCAWLQLGYRLKVSCRPSGDLLAALRTAKGGLLLLQFGEAQSPDLDLKIEKLRVDADGRFSFETEAPLRTFNAYRCLQCLRFYEALQNEVLRLWIDIDAAGERSLVIRARFSVPQGAPWPQPSAGAGDVLELAHALVFEAFRDYVDIVARTRRLQDNALLLASRDPGLTVSQTVRLFAAIEADRRAHPTGREQAVEPLKRCLENAVALFTTLSEERAHGPPR